MKLRQTQVWLSLLVLAVSCPNQLDAQTATSGALTGVITDQSNAVLPGASVEIKDNSKGITQSTKTDREGVYRFFFLAPSRYTLTVTHDGFQEETRAVSVQLGPPGTVNIALRIVKARSEVTVTDEAPLLHAENGDVSTTMTQHQIAELPNPGNDIAYIAQTSPGSVMDTDMMGTAFSILGMSGLSYQLNIDGLSDTENFDNAYMSGVLFSLLGQNQIQEATVESTGYSGRFGGYAGGNINYATKSGGKVFHGNAQFYWNGTVLNANEWFQKAAGQRRPFDVAEQWAGSFSGPIKKEKLFFFLDTEGLRVNIPGINPVQAPSPQFEAATMAHIDSTFGSGSASHFFYRKVFDLYDHAPGAASAQPGDLDGGPGCGDTPTITPPCIVHYIVDVPRPSHDSLIEGRLDWNLRQKDQAFLRVQYDSGRASFYTDPINPVFDVSYTQPWWQAQVVETHTFSPSAASQFVVAASYQDGIFSVNHPDQALAALGTKFVFVGNGFNNIGQEPLPSEYPFYRYQLSEDITKVAGKHELAFGGQWERTDWGVVRNPSVGTLFPQTLDAFYQGGVDPATPNVDFTQLVQSFPTKNYQRLSFSSFGLYAQDAWRVRPNLVLTAALRVEHYSNPVCRSRCFARLAGPFETLSHDPGESYKPAIQINQEHALLNTDAALWAPRLSFAWQPLGVSHHTVVRGGIGLFYDRVPGVVPGSFDTNAPVVNTFTLSGDSLAPNEKSSLFTDAINSNTAFKAGFDAGYNLAQIQATVTGFSPPGMFTSARTIHSPQFQKWSLELQQAFGTGTSLSVGYYGHHGIHELAQNQNANAYGFGSLPAGLCSSPPVPPCADPRFRGVTQFNTNAVSNYHGAVVSFRRRVSQWGKGEFQANYTFGHAFDEVSNGGIYGFTQGSSIFPQDPGNLRGSYGPAEYDVRHSLNANYVWELPVKAALAGHGPDFLVKGWQISGTVFFHSAFPYTVFDQVMMARLAANNFFGSLYSVPVGPLHDHTACGEAAVIIFGSQSCLPPQLLSDNTTPSPEALFLQTGCETGFNTGHLPGKHGPCSGALVSFAQRRNQFRGLRYWNTDFAIMKSTKIPRWEKAELGIGFQFFNLFNHPNFGFPDNWSSDPAEFYGRIFYLQQPSNSILGTSFYGDFSPRMIQLKTELRF